MGPREILRLSFPDLGSLEREIATNIRYGRLFVGEVLDAPVLSEGDLVLVHPVHGRELRLLAQVVMVNSDGPMRGTGIALRGFGPTEVERLQAFVREQVAMSEPKPEVIAARAATVPPTAPENDWSDLATSGFARSAEVRTTPPPVAARASPIPVGPIAIPIPEDLAVVAGPVGARAETMLEAESGDWQEEGEGYAGERGDENAHENEDEDEDAHENEDEDEDAHENEDEDAHAHENEDEDEDEDEAEVERELEAPSCAEDDFSELNDSPPLAAAAAESTVEDFDDEGEGEPSRDGESAAFDHGPSLEAPKNTDLQAGESRQERLRSLNVVEQLKIARRGELADRIVIERLYGKTVWEALLQNPRITLPEVARIARKGTVPRPLIEAILENGMWIRDVNVRRSLLSNPKLPSDGILKLLRAMAKHELKLLERAAAYPMSVRDAARKLLREQQT